MTRSFFVLYLLFVNLAWIRAGFIRIFITFTGEACLQFQGTNRYFQ